MKNMIFKKKKFIIILSFLTRSLFMIEVGFCGNTEMAAERSLVKSF